MCPEQEDKEKSNKRLVKNYIRQSLHSSLKCLSATLVTKQKGQLQILNQCKLNNTSKTRHCLFKQRDLAFERLYVYF